MIDYEKKARKYKMKYELLLQKLKLNGYDVTDSQDGGFSRDDYLVFENELKQIYNLVSGEFDEDDGEFIALTGSGALAYILFNLGMNEELEEMAVPNDLDIVYYTKNKLNNFTKSTIGDYVVEPGKQTLDSRPFILRPELQSGKKILQFDLTKMKERKPEFIQLSNRVLGKSININILNLDKLKELYEDSETDQNQEKIKSRIQLINKIISHIRNSGDPELMEKYKLFKNVTTRTETRPKSFEADKFVIKSNLFDEDEGFLSFSGRKRTELESSQPSFRFEDGLKNKSSPFKRRIFEESDDETLDGLSELEDRFTVKKSNKTEKSLGGVEDTLDGLTEVEQRKPSKSTVSRNLFGMEDDEEELGVEETLDGLTEVEEKKLNQKSSSIKLPPIRPFP